MILLGVNGHKVEYTTSVSPLLVEFLPCRQDVENEHDVHAVAIHGDISMGIRKRRFVRTA